MNPPKNPAKTNPRKGKGSKPRPTNLPFFEAYLSQLFLPALVLTIRANPGASKRQLYRRFMVEHNQKLTYTRFEALVKKSGIVFNRVTTVLGADTTPPAPPPTLEGEGFTTFDPPITPVPHSPPEPGSPAVVEIGRIQLPVL